MKGYFLAMSSTGPWPDTSTHLSWYFLNIFRGLWDIMTWSWDIWGRVIKFTTALSDVPNIKHLPTSVFTTDLQRKQDAKWTEKLMILSKWFVHDLLAMLNDAVKVNLKRKAYLCYITFKKRNEKCSPPVSYIHVFLLLVIIMDFCRLIR